MYKRVLNSNQLRAVAGKAISLVADPVKRTLGPAGQPIIVELAGQNPDGSSLDPIITKDGVTVAEHASFRDPALNTIVKTIIQVAKKTVSQGGDGTTTSVVLAEAIYKEGMKYVERGANNIELYNALKAIKDEVLEYIDEIKIDVTTDEQIKNVAMISSNGDEEIATIVVEAIKAAGEHGYIELEDGYTKNCVINVIDGASYKRGWRNFGPNGSLMVNDKAKNSCELTGDNGVATLLYAGKLDNVHELHDLINKLYKFDENKGFLTEIFPFLIVAYDYSDDVRNFILQQRTQAKLPLAAIKAPADGSPNSRTEMLYDMAALTGATVSARGILDLDKVDETHLGGAESVSISPEDTVFYNVSGDKADVKRRIKELDTLLETSTLDPWDQQNIRLRKGKLSQGIVIVRVGGDTEPEMKEKKDRAEDALCAAKVAVKAGVVPGGGVTLYNASYLIDRSNAGSIADKIMAVALRAPMRQIIENAGKSPEKIFTVLEMDPGENNDGYDARTHKFANMVDSGILDPAKVTKSALENAVSIAGLLLTTGGALISDVLPEDGKENPLAAMFGA